MPIKTFIDKLMYRKFRYIRETCEDDNLSNKKKIVIIKAQAEAMEHYLITII